jgi:2'-5' RNA ligase
MRELSVFVPLRHMRAGDIWAAGSLPLHVTVLSNFHVDDVSVPELIAKISAIARETPVLETSAEALAWFGPNRDIAVTTLLTSAPLGHLHHRLLEAATAVGAKWVNPFFNAEGYRPHATRTIEGEAVTRGEPVILDSLVVLDCSTDTRRALSLSPFTDFQKPQADGGTENVVAE